MRLKVIKIIETVMLLLFCFGGIILGGISIVKCQNYRHPVLFGFVFALLGLLVSMYFSKKIKSPLNFKALPDIFKIIMPTGVIGCFMFSGYYLNRSVSKLEKCDRYTVIAKEFKSGGSKGSDLNTLVIDVDGQNERLLCSRNYWQSVSVGKKINVCIYSSLLGFDNLDPIYDRR